MAQQQLDLACHNKVARFQQPRGYATPRQRRPTSAVLVAATTGAVVFASLFTWRPILQQAALPAKGEASFGMLKPAFFNPFGDPEPEPEEYQQDWKEEAFRRQQEKINARKRRLNNDIPETPQEKEKRLQREYRWKKAQRQDESVAMIGETMKVKVSVMPPLGIDFQFQSGGPTGVFAKVTGFKEVGNGQYMDINVGDRIYSIEGLTLNINTMEEAMAIIKNASKGEKSVTFVFERPVSNL